MCIGPDIKALCQDRPTAGLCSQRAARPKIHKRGSGETFGEKWFYMCLFVKVMGKQTIDMFKLKAR